MKEYDELETKQKCVNEVFKFNNVMFCNNGSSNNGNPFMNMMSNTSASSDNGGFFSTNTNYDNNNVSSTNNNNNVHSFFSTDNDDNINEHDNLPNHNPFLLNNNASSLATPSFNNIYQQQEISIKPTNTIDYNTCSDKYILTNLSLYDFTANKYISKGNGYITIEKHNNTYFIIYRNTTYRILLTCIIYPQTTSFTPSTQTPLIAVINKLLNITLSPHKPCSLKLKFQTQSDRTSFQTIFTNITSSSLNVSPPSNEPITHISSFPVYTIYLPQFK